MEEFDVEGTWEKGDEVFGLVYGGAYAEHVAVDARMLVRKPEELGWEECAAVPEVSGLCVLWPNVSSIKRDAKALTPAIHLFSMQSSERSKNNH